MRRTIVLSILLVGGVLLAGGCEALPRGEDSLGGYYTKNHHGRTALRGMGVKRLIPTYTELNELHEQLSQRMMDETDPERIEAGTELLEDVDVEIARVHKSLDLRRRLKWHRVRVGKLWRRYRVLYPEDQPLRRTYKKERRVDRDEIRNRRTPLTQEMRWSPRNKPRWDTIPEEQGMWTDRAVVELPKPAWYDNGGVSVPAGEPGWVDPEPMIDLFNGDVPSPVMTPGDMPARRPDGIIIEDI